MKQPILGVTMGDPAGVGPEIIARAAVEPAIRRESRPVVIGAAATMRAALGLVGSSLTLHAVARVGDCRWTDGTLEVLDLANVDMATLPRAEVSAAAGRAAYAYIERAVALATAGEIAGIVTAPVNKEALAASLEKLIVNPELRKTFGEKGRARAIEHFSLENHIAKFEKIFGQLI